MNASRRPLRALAPLLAVLTVLTVLTGCATSTSTSPDSVATSTFVSPNVTINPVDRAKNVAPSTAVTVTANGGNIASVAVYLKGTKTVIPGALTTDHKTWKASEDLAPDSSYTVAVDAEGPGGTATNALSTFSTSGGKHLITQATPNNGEVVGVGQPVVLTFNTPIPHALQAELVSQIHVTSTPSVMGDWHWFSPTEVHWRPEVFWPAHTQVTVTAHLQGVSAGNGFWGYGNWTSRFTIGDKHLSTIDHATETMRVYTNDKLVRTIPVSLGKAGFPTISGTLIVHYKSQAVMMDSCASGIDCEPGTTNYYKEYVYWDTAISTDGFFVHDAYWDIFAQGHYDYSHGCVNVAPANAIWFFGYSLTGDVVIIKGTGRIADAGDGEGDWQIPYASWANSGGEVTTAPTTA